PRVALNRWQKEGDVAMFQRYSAGNDPKAKTANDNFMNSDGMIADASFGRLKTLAVRYNFSKPLCKKLFIQEGSVYIQAQNLFTITHLDGFDPEYNPFKTTLYTLPPLRTIAVG